jgi:hypothetical protein
MRQSATVFGSCGNLLQCSSLQQHGCAAVGRDSLWQSVGRVRAAVRSSLCDSVRQCMGNVWQCVLRCGTAVRQCAAVRAGVCGSAYFSATVCCCPAVRQCATVRQCVAVWLSMQQYVTVWRCAAVRAQCEIVRQCAAVWQCGSATVCCGAAMCVSARGGVRQCARRCAVARGQCAAVCTAVFGSAHNSVQQRRGNMRQCCT